MADVVEAGGDAIGADVVGAGVLFDVSAAGVLVAVLQGGEDFGQGDVHGLEQVGVDGHFVLPELAAQRIDLHYAFDAGELAAHDPVLHAAEVHVAVPVREFRVNQQYVLVDLAEAGGNRGHFRAAEAGGDIGFRFPQVFADELATEVDVGVLFEDDRYHGESEAADGADFHQVLEILQRQLDGGGDELLHLLGGQRGGGRDDLHLVVGDVGDGVDGDLPQGKQAPDDEGQDANADEQLIPDGIGDDGVEHGRQA